MASLPSSVVALIPLDGFEPPIVQMRWPASSGLWRVVPRIVCRRINHIADGLLSTAQFEMKHDAAFQLDGSTVTLEGPNNDVPSLLNSRVRVIRMLPRNRIEVLFDGYPDVSRPAWGNDSEALPFSALSVLRTWAEAPNAQVYGRWMRRGIDQRKVDPKDESTWAGEQHRVTALPAVFVIDGRPNRAPEPLRVKRAPVKGETVEEAFDEIPIFTDDHDPRGRHWSLAQALRYLLYFHRPHIDTIDSRDLFALTGPLIRNDPVDGGGGGLASALTMRLTNLRTEAVSLLDAIRLLADMADLHFAVDFNGDTAPGSVFNDFRAPGNRFVLWSGTESLVRGQGAKAFYLEKHGTSQAGRTRRQALGFNNIDGAAMDVDYRGLRNRVTVLGGVEHYTMRVELVPGWEPEIEPIDGVVPLDNIDPADSTAIDAAKKLALLELGDKFADLSAAKKEWFNRYVRINPTGTFRGRVGRWWVLNEGADFDAATFARAVGLYDADRYDPFNFADVIAGPRFSGAEPRDWALIRRRFLAMPVDRSGNNPHLSVAQAIFEMSFDDGANWRRPSTLTARLMTDQCGIAVENPYLTSITDPTNTDDDENYWFALIENRLRVRITAQVRGDGRVTATQDGTFNLLRGAPRVSVISAGERFRHLQVSGTNVDTPDVNGLPAVNAARQLDRDDTATARAFAAALVGRTQDRRFAVNAVINGRIDTYYRLGDRISGVVGRGIDFARQNAGNVTLPFVVGREFSFAGDSVSTRITLEDFRGAPEFTVERR